MQHDLRNKVCMVTGASRSVGQTIAEALGGAGATVYVVGRSVTGKQTGNQFPGDTIEETARLVDTAGGTGIPLAVDLRADDAIEACFTQIAEEQGRLDLVVNNAWAGYEDYGDNFTAPFWEQPVKRWDAMLNVGVRSTLVVSMFAARQMIQQGSGLIINTTVLTRPDKYLGSAIYDTAKTAINRITYTTAQDLEKYPVSVVGVAPGWMRTKILYDIYKTDAEHWHEIDELANTESTWFAARAVVAVATDPEVRGLHGQSLSAAQLSARYGFSDVDGRRPDFYREVMGMEPGQ